MDFEVSSYIKDAVVNVGCPASVCIEVGINKTVYTTRFYNGEPRDLKNRVGTPYVFAKKLPREGTQSKTFLQKLSPFNCLGALSNDRNLPDGGLPGPHYGPLLCPAQNSCLNSSAASLRHTPHRPWAPCVGERSPRQQPCTVCRPRLPWD